MQKKRHTCFCHGAMNIAGLLKKLLKDVAEWQKLCGEENAVQPFIDETILKNCCQTGREHGIAV